MGFRIPDPVARGSMPSVDPYADREGFHHIVSELYRAELAALEGFSLLCEPKYVESNDIFRKAMHRLVEEEAEHADYYYDMIRKIGYEEMMPPHPEAEKFWTGWREGKVFSLPLSAPVAALFCLLSEGLGYAFLYHVGVACTDPEMRAMFMDHLEDEKSHLRMSMSVLEKSLRSDEGRELDLLVHAYAYFVRANKAVKHQRPLMERLGFDYFAMVASSMDFVLELLQRVYEKSGRGMPAPSMFQRLRDISASPRAVRFAQGLVAVKPPGLFGMVRAFGWLRRPRRSAPAVARPATEGAA